MTRFISAKHHKKPDPAWPVSHFQRIIATIPWLSTSPRRSTDPAHDVSGGAGPRRMAGRGRVVSTHAPAPPFGGTVRGSAPRNHVSREATAVRPWSFTRRVSRQRRTLWEVLIP
ncbi:MAG: hypothetical protein HY567_02295 [Candidatus Kerfeldbacteria bacterium]|nr:hypothetical protein [Candidatus Kerfeldbacteria bacterium]